MKSVVRFLVYLLLAAIVIHTPLDLYLSSKTIGWDHEIYCRAISAESQGKDPFLTRNLGSTLSYTYPALFLDIYSPMCSLKPRMYLGVHFAVLIGIVVLITLSLKTGLFLTAAWVFLGFNAAYANYTTGNIGVFEAFLFALFLLFYHQKKWWSGLFLAPSAFLKIVPSIMILPPLIRKPVSLKWSLSIVGGFGAVLGALNLATYIRYPLLYWSFFDQVLGRHAIQHSPIAEVDSNPSNFTVPLFLKNFSELFFQGSATYIFVTLLLALTAFTFWLWKRNIKNEENDLIRICWVYLILMLWLPRLKPYSMLLVCMALLPILKGKSRAALSWGLLLISIFHRSLNGDKADPTWDFIANNTAIYAYIGMLILLSFSRSQDYLLRTRSRV